MRPGRGLISSHIDMIESPAADYPVFLKKKEGVGLSNISS